MVSRKTTRNVACLSRLALALVLVSGAPLARAVDFKTGNPDFKIRWDNTVKYSAGLRLKDQDPALVSAMPASVNQDDGDRNFDKGLMQNRFDLLSELDVQYKGFGARASAAGWYDFVYNTGNDNTSIYTVNSFSRPAGEFTDVTRDLAGRKIELLDAFIFANIHAGDMSGSIKAGRHALQWGESLFFGANGIAGTMAPVDVMKLLGVPNAQFKEIIMPVTQISVQWQFTPKFTMGAYYQLEWRRSRLPASGSYYSFSDTIDAGAERLITGEPHAPFLGPPSFFRSSDIEADDDGQYGVQARFRLGETDLGLYFTNFHAKDPAMYMRPQGVPNFQTGQIGTYQFVFAEDVKAVGASVARSFGVWSTAAEVSYRFDAPLVSAAGVVPPIPGFPADNSAHPLYAVGETLHAQANWLATFGPTFLSQESAFLGEVAWHRVMSFTKNETAVDPSTTRDAWGFRLVFEPTYRQVLSGLDLSVPVGIGYNPKGSSMAIETFNGGADDGGDLNVGVTGTFNGAYKFSINWTTYLGEAGTYLDAANHRSFDNYLKDRDTLTFSVRTTF
ncbi:MAG: DUF1302 domain-containing protein [Holophagales bacterium]|nr:DUF1302 domain-containing protein [Holophagales bacterium]MBK9969109.1 DUF1302 domain-containing protein [Holophagales bacterium]